MRLHLTTDEALALVLVIGNLPDASSIKRCLTGVSDRLKEFVKNVTGGNEND